jgi:oligopeptide transport system substrate-binding protein
MIVNARHAPPSGFARGGRMPRTAWRPRILVGVLLALLINAAAIAAPVVLHRGNPAEPDTLDAQKSSIDYTIAITVDLMLGLTQGDANFQATPGAAESWTVSPDGLVYTFKLRPGLVWSDGAPLTADDAVFALRRYVTPSTLSPNAFLAFKIKNAPEIQAGKLPPDKLGVRAIDTRTLEMTLSAPNPNWLNVLAEPQFAPLPRHVIAKHGDNWTKPGIIVTSGAYTLADWRSGDHVRLVKNPKFYDAKNVSIDDVIYYPTEDDAAALKRFRAGELDINARFSSTELVWLKKNMPQAASISPAAWGTRMVVNLSLPKFADRRVRRALALALDREAIVDKILRTGETPAYGIMPPVAPGYAGAVADFKSMPMDKRLAEARALLKSAGYTDTKPLAFVLSQRMGVANKRVAVAVQDMWTKIGVKTELRFSDVSMYYGELRKQNYEVALTGAAWPPDPEHFLNDLVTASPQNYPQYKNKAYDDAIAAAGLIPDRAPRYAAFQKAEAIALADLPLIPLYFNSNTALVSPKIKGYRENGRDLHPTRTLRIER